MNKLQGFCRLNALFAWGSVCQCLKCESMNGTLIQYQGVCAWQLNPLIKMARAIFTIMM